MVSDVMRVTCESERVMVRGRRECERVGVKVENLAEVGLVCGDNWRVDIRGEAVR
jgi:hypothetical protein